MRKIALLALVSWLLVPATTSAQKPKVQPLAGGGSQTELSQLKLQVASLQSQVTSLQSILRMEGSTLRIENQGPIVLKSQQKLTVHGMASLDLRSDGVAELKGAQVKLPSSALAGGKPIAKVGAAVIGVCPPTGGPLVQGKVMP